MMSVISDVSFTRFGKRPEGLLDLVAESALPIVRRYGRDIDFIVFSNSYSGEFNDMSCNLFAAHDPHYCRCNGIGTVPACFQQILYV